VSSKMQDSSMCRTLVIRQQFHFGKELLCVYPKEGRDLFLRSGYFNYHVLHIILTTKLQYTFVTNKFISINFLFSLINSSSFVIRLMKNTLIELVQNPTKIVKHSII